MVVKEEIKTMTPSMAYELGTMAYELGYVTCLMGEIRLVWLIMYSGNYFVLHTKVVMVIDYKSKAILANCCCFLYCGLISTTFEVLIN